MAKVKRQVIKIDEERCNGCGQCVPNCAEGAIQIIDGKARLVSDNYCDGLGACLGHCPMGALGFEEREADEFDETAAVEHVKSIRPENTPAPHNHAHAHHGGCPSAKVLDFRSEARQAAPAGDQPHLESELRQWPVKLYLVSPNAPYFADADLLVAADCTAFAYASVHPDFMRGKALVIGCPKFDDIDEYTSKLTAIISQNNIKSVTVLHMEVPCCFGMKAAVTKAVAAAGKEDTLPVQAKVVTLRGEIKDPTGVASLF